jgi:putative Holliday junction resolvase
MGRLLGVDPGSKRIGLAISDPEGRLASPHGVIAAGEDSAAAIARIAGENEVEEIVVGHPRRLDGTVGLAAEQAEALAARIETAAGIPVRLWDERLTSAQGEKAMIAHGAKRRARRDAADRIAATIILQSFLDARRSSR